MGVRNSEGQFLVAAAQSFKGHVEVDVAEAVAIREALSWLKNRGWSHVIVKSDAQSVVHVINDQVVGPSVLGTVVYDISLLKTKFVNISFRFSKRSANRVAHAIARASDSLSDLMVWQDVLYQSLVSLLRFLQSSLPLSRKQTQRGDSKCLAKGCPASKLQ